MQINQSLLFLGILFSREQEIIPLTEDEKSQIEDYSNATITVMTISDEASNIKSMSKTEAVRTCGRIRDQLQLLIKATETAISQVNVKENKIKGEMLNSHSTYSKISKELTKQIGIKRELEEALTSIQREEFWLKGRAYMKNRMLGRPSRYSNPILQVFGLDTNPIIQEVTWRLENPEKVKELDNINIRFLDTHKKLELTKTKVEELASKKNELDKEQRKSGQAKVELSKANALLKNTLQKYNFLSDDVKLIREFFNEGILEESQIDDFVDDLKTIEASLPKLEN